MDALAPSERPAPEPEDGRQAPAPFLAGATAPEPAHRSRLRTVATCLFWLASLAIAAASGLAMTALLQRADSRRQTQLVLAEIDSHAANLRHAEVRAADSTADRDLFVAATRRAAAVIPLALDQLLDLDPEGDAADRVREAVEQFRSNARQHLRLLVAGAPAEALAWDRERAQPSFRLLGEAVLESTVFYSAQARVATARARSGSLVAIGSEALLIGLLSFLSTRSHHAAERKRLAERAAGAARFEALVNNASDVIVVLDRQGTILYESPSVTRVLGFAPNQGLGKNTFSFVEPGGRSNGQRAFARVLGQPGKIVTGELPVRHADGSLRWLEVSATNLLADPNVGGIVVNYRDVTCRRSFQEQLRHQALHDPLTGLANRELFAQLVGKALARARRAGHPVALFYLDLDGFKPINDKLGHHAGDELLIEVARRLEHTLRAGDTAARLGGDEFAVLLDQAGREEAKVVAERVVAEIDAPFVLAAGRAAVGTSLGIAVSAANEQSADELLRQADVAMYVAKARGKGRCEFFEPGMHVMTKRRTRAAADLERAIARDELALQYQPVIQLGTGSIVGVEALVRWKEPGGKGLVQPAEFLPLAEESGLIVPLGRWVLRHACRQAREWQLLYPSEPPLLLSVNLSARQFADPGLAEEVAGALSESGLPAASLVLEVAEAVLMQDPTEAQARLERLRRLGVLLAIDDFGFGLSCVNYLQGFAADLVKIDKGFIDHIAVGGASSKLALRIIEQARRLSLQTVAEGIEQQDQLAQVAQAGCDLAQGFSLARPLDPTDLEALLRSEAPEREYNEPAGAVALGLA